MTCFKVSTLSDRVFKFSVAAKENGLFIRRLFAFEWDLYKVSFHLWGNGGPNWHRELELFMEEEQSSWRSASNRCQVKPSYAAIVRSSPAKPPLSGANAIPLGNGRARFPAMSPSLRRPAPPRKSVLERLEFPQKGIASFTSRAGNAPPRPHLRQPRRGGAAMAMVCARCLATNHDRSRLPRGMSLSRVLSWPLNPDIQQTMGRGKRRPLKRHAGSVPKLWAPRSRWCSIPLGNGLRPFRYLGPNRNLCRS